MSRKMTREEARELGRRGGLANKANHPDDYFKILGKKGIEIRWAKYRKTKETQPTT